MNKVSALLPCLAMSASACAQPFIIKLPHDNPVQVVWENQRKAYFSEDWSTPVVTNVSSPILQVYAPANGTANGTSVVVAPGGAFYALSIESEGELVARWLSARGITVFVLNYRLVPSGEDGVKEISWESDLLIETIAPVVAMATADGLAAMTYVRTNADRYGLDPEKIGFMGFSAGGTVAMGVLLNFTPVSRPDFAVTVYPWMSALGDYDVPDDAPPMLIVCAADDGLGLAPESLRLYSDWREAGISAGLHMYSKGDHGFGMRKNGLPSDNWIDRFYEWSVAEGMTVPVDPAAN